MAGHWNETYELTYEGEGDTEDDQLDCDEDGCGDEDQ